MHCFNFHVFIKLDFDKSYVDTSHHTLLFSYAHMHIKVIFPILYPWSHMWYVVFGTLQLFFFQKTYFRLISNQNTTKFTIKIHKDNLSGISIYNIEGQLQNQQKDSKTHISLLPTNLVIIPNPTYRTKLFYNKVILVIRLW